MAAEVLMSPAGSLAKPISWDGRQYWQVVHLEQADQRTCWMGKSLTDDELEQWTPLMPMRRRTSGGGRHG